MGIFMLHLNETQLLPVLEAAVGASIAGFTLDAYPAEEGDQSGDKQFCTFHYTTQSGQSGQVTLFAKRCVWKGRSEAVHYRHLSARGVPTPRLYGALTNDAGEEIVFLERLTATGFRNDSETEWRRMLSLLARLNACAITPDYVPHLYPYEQIGAIDGRWWISGLNARPTDKEIEAVLRACGVEDKDLPTLCAAAQNLFAQVAAQPQGLLHLDFMPDNLGWRGERAEMVVFDLHKNNLGPRFADVAPYLGLPDWSDRAAFLDNAQKDALSRRASLSQHYLDEYARFGGPTVTLETFREETTLLSWAHKVSALFWLVEQKQQSRIREILDFLYGQTPSER